jgi:gamma-glutamyltranspeptidase/glutathione hydrolase
MTVDSVPERVGSAGSAGPPGRALRPEALGRHYAVAAGHPLAALAAFRILEAGGNAVDAGVAGGICLGVVHSDIVNFAGVAPIMLYDAARREVATVSGLGPWPRRASVEFFQRACGGEIPEGILRTVVPGAPDAWLTALERFGTLGFAEVAAPAIELAREGFPLGAFVAGIIRQNEAKYRRWPTSAPIYLPGGRPPGPGQRFVQADLGRTLQYLADEDRAARSRGRAAGLQAARDAFYRGDVAASIADYHAREGGLLTREDLAAFRAEVEPARSSGFRGYQVWSCGFWCQGPVLLQMLQLLEPLDLSALGHNSPDYIHVVTEAMKLAFADREAYYGDPRHVKVPERLLDPAYAAVRRRLLDARRASPAMPPPGDPSTGQATAPAWTPPSERARPGSASLDTSYIAVVDRDGNAFSATPSDVSTDTPIIPGTGLAVSSRGSQSWLEPEHPSVVAPGKRPRLTPNPAMVFHEGRVMPFGTPGGDVQAQAMLQVLLNLTVFGMSPQSAVEAPRFATQSFPDSFWPHRYFPGRLTLEGRIPQATADALAGRGHRVERWGDWEWRAGGACLVRVDEAGVRWGAADPRRDSYAVAW